MRGSNSRAQASNDRASRRGRPRAAQGAHRFGHMLAVLFLFAGLVTQVTSVTAAPAPTTSTAATTRLATAPAFPAPQTVIAVGDFQTQLGCGASDKTCQATSLQNDGSGIWSGAFTVTPGTYAFRIVTSGDQERSLGKGGSPDGGDLSVNVGSSDAAVYFSYDQNTGAISGAGSSHVVTLQTDSSAFAMAPGKNGAFTASVSGPAGSSLNAQVIVDGQPVGDPQPVDAGQSGRVKVTADDSGHIQSADAVQTATLTITKVDGSGSPLAGSCFGVFEGGKLAGQACDSGNGSTTINFPDGVPGSATLKETVTPGGQTKGDDQPINLQAGQNQATVTIAGGGGDQTPTEQPVDQPTDQPVDQPTDAVPVGAETPTPADTQAATVQADLYSTDENGNALAGACFTVDGGDQLCDTKGTGFVSTELTPGDHSLKETTTPNGFKSLGKTTITVPEGGGTITLQHTANAPVNGTLTITVAGSDGAAVSGACFTIDPSIGDKCANGTDLTLSDLTPGTYTVTQSKAPASYDVDPNAQQVDVAAGETATLSFVDATTPPPAGEIDVTTTDGNGAVVPGACYVATDSTTGTASGEVCDSNNDGITNFKKLPPDPYVIKQSRTPDGFDPAADADTTVASGAKAAVDVVDNKAVPPTETPVPAGVVSIRYNDSASGKPVAGACFTVSNDAQSFGPVCDGDGSDQDKGDGRVQLNDVPVGDYTITQTQAPAGYLNSDPAPATVAAKKTVKITLKAALATGSIDVTTTDGSKNVVNACYSLDNGKAVCDDNSDGVVTFDGVSAGDHSVAQTSVPAGFTASSPVSQSVTVAVGAAAALSFTAPVSTGGIDVATQSNGKAIQKACYSLDGANPLCATAKSGAIAFDNVTPGDHTITQISTPDGYNLSDPAAQTVTVAGGQRASLTFEITIQNGSVEITTSQGGAPIPGACYTLNGGDPVCDTSGAGSVTFKDIAPGSYTLSQTTAPDGYKTVKDQKITVKAGQAATVTFENVAVPPTNTPTDVPTETPTATEIPTNTATATEAPTETATATNVPTETPTDTPTATEAPTDTPTNTATPTEAATATEVPTETATATEAPTDTATATETSTAAPTNTATVEPTPTSTEAAATPTSTEAAATQTSTEAATATATTEPTQEATSTPAPTQTPAATATTEPDAGSVTISKTDDKGAALGGACFSLTGSTSVGPVCDNQDGDGSAANGTIAIANVPAGPYLLTETQTPDGYSSSAPITITVTANQETKLTVVDSPVAPATGSLHIVIQDQAGNAIGGACFTISAVDYCDNGPNDSDNAGGSIQLSGLAAGAYTVAASQTPSGFDAPSSQSVQIVADQTQELVFKLNAAAPKTGGLQFDLRDKNGQAVDGACIQLTSDATNYNQQFCDNGNGDTDPAVGKLVVTGLPVGVYSATQANPPTAQSGRLNALAPAPLANADTKTVTVQANVIIIIIIIIIVEPPSVGNLQIVKRASDSNLLQGGACFKIDGPGGVNEVCDNDSSDGSATSGIIRFNDLPLGVYAVTETTAPAGYQISPSQSVTIVAGTNSVLFKDIPVVNTKGGLIVSKTDNQAVVLKGSCFELLTGTTVIAGPVCDPDDGANDGKVTFTNVEKGSYTLRETTAPTTDYDLAPDQTVTIVAAKNDTKITVVDPLKPGTLQITKTAVDGVTLLDGSCFGLDRGAGIEFEVCDQQTGDANSTVGILYWPSIPPGNYTLTETQSPLGYNAASDQAIVIKPGKGLNLIVKNTPTPPPANTGTVVIKKVGPDAKALAGACFALRLGTMTKYSRCDAADGASDGTITFTTVGVGTYVLRETKAPTADYLLVADQTIKVTKDQTTTVTVKDVKKPGRITIIKTNQNGDPLQNACFVLAPDPNAAGELCTNASGQITFDKLPPSSTYKVTETKAPSGYEKGPAQSGIAVKPGLTTTVNVLDKKTPPPPTDGSILVIKFFCQVTKGVTSATLIIDSSKPGSNQLPKTANCTKGDATFSMTPAAGAGFTFNTGSDGEYHATLAKGAWKFKETAPSNAGPTETVTIYASQQTTVVVIDYVQPPKPKPVTINVVKYTCDPGFNAVYFADFIANCSDPGQLTNGISFRITGDAAVKRITGSNGVGKTTFAGLAAGSYTLNEDLPNASTTSFGFCGYDPANPAWRTTTGKLAFTLGQGDVYSCTWFNVPDKVTSKTGVIVVHKYVCDAAAYPANFDWYGNCSVLTDGATFSISTLQGGKFVQRATATTNANGLITFNTLTPGVYKLAEIGANWCHAESNSVNSQGNVVVKANERSEVWIFDCVPTKSPPNTGAGPNATSNPTAHAPASQVLQDNSLMLWFGFAWPLLALGGFGLRRRNRRIERRTA